VAEELGCAYYYAGVVDCEDWLENWLRDGGWIVATSALGTVVDFLGVVYIVHVHMPWTVIDFA
jgi:superfamily II DNA helicase RecQ